MTEETIGLFSEHEQQWVYSVHLGLSGEVFGVEWTTNPLQAMRFENSRSCIADWYSRQVNEWLVRESDPVHKIISTRPIATNRVHDLP